MSQFSASRRTAVGISITVLLVLFVTNVFVLFSGKLAGFLYEERLPRSTGNKEQTFGEQRWQLGRPPTPLVETRDQHPIRGLMADADNDWKKHVENRSRTYKATLERYREKYGRHPPPGFKQVHRAHGLSSVVVSGLLLTCLCRPVV